MNANDRKLVLLNRLFHAIGLAGLVVGGCSYHFAASALLTQRQVQLRGEITRLDAALDTRDETQLEYQELMARLRDLEQRAETMHQRIPDLPHEADFLNQVARAARARGLTIQNYTRGNVTVRGSHSELEIRLAAEGNYASICGFFEEIANLPRVATVQQLRLAAPTGSDVYPLNMTLTLYFGARAPSGGNHG